MGKQVLPTKEYIQNILKSTTVSVECSYGTEVVLSELYDRIYEKGRADAIEDMTKCKDALCHSCKQYDREHYQCPIWCKVISGTIEEIKYQTRADAIDEILKYKYCVYDDDGIGHIVVNVSNIEQIKENNE